MHVSQICPTVLPTPHRQVDAMRTAILNFIATVSVAHADALATLLQSQALIPCLVMLLTQITCLFWEDDGGFIADTIS